MKIPSTFEHALDFLDAWAVSPSLASLGVLTVLATISFKIFVGLRRVTLSSRQIKLEEARTLYEMLSQKSESTPEVVKDIIFRDLTRINIGITQASEIYRSDPERFRERVTALDKFKDLLYWDKKAMGVRIRDKKRTIGSIFINGLLYVLFAYNGINMSISPTQPLSLNEASNPTLWLGTGLTLIGALFLIGSFRAGECLLVARRFEKEQRPSYWPHLPRQ